MATGSIKKVSNEQGTSYIKFPTGLMIAFGWQPDTSTGYKQFSWEVPFVSTPWMVACPRYQSGSTDLLYTTVASPTPTNAIIYFMQTNGAESLKSTNASAYFIAIGRWK